MDDTVSIMLAAFIALAVNFVFSSVISQLTGALVPNSTAVELALFLVLNILLIITSFHISFKHINRHRHG